MAVKTIIKKEPIVGGFIITKISNMDEKELEEGVEETAEDTPVEEVLKEEEKVEPESI